MPPSDDILSDIRGARLLSSVLVTTVVLSGTLTVTFGTEWGWERQLFRGVVLLSLLALGLSALPRFRAYRRPTALSFVGVLVFWFGTAGGVCTQPGVPPEVTWQLTYDWRQNVIYFGWPVGTFDGYTCYGVPNRPLAIVGHLLTTVGTALGSGALELSE